MANQLFGKYQVLEPLGQGGFGTVYLGLDLELNRKVAIKTCNSSDRHLRDRFRREARIAASLQHAAIVTVFDSGEENGVPYLVQEFLDGEDLSSQIGRNPPLPLERKAGYLLEIARGLAYAHSHGIVHRDIKPANIRVLPDGPTKILDFGIAKLLQAESQLTRTGMTMGTAGYMPPEQILGKPVDQRADIFAFGVLAYELLTGRQPFAGDDLSAVFYRILHEDPKPIPELWPGCPKELAEALRRCLEKNPEDRFPSFAPVVALLAPFAEHLETSAAMSLGAASSRPAPRPLAPAWSTARAAGSRLSGWRSFSESAYRTGLRLRRMSLVGLLTAVSLVAVTLYGTWMAPRLWQHPARQAGSPSPAEPHLEEPTPRTPEQPGTMADPPEAETEPQNLPREPAAPRQREPISHHSAAEPPGGGPDRPVLTERGDSVEPNQESPPPVPPITIDEPVTAEQEGVEPSVPDLRVVSGRGTISAPETPRSPRIVVLIRGDVNSGATTTETALLNELESLGLAPEGGGRVSPGDRESVVSGDLGAIAQVAQRLRSDLILTGELTSEVQPTVSRFFAGRAALELRVYEASGGRLLHAETIEVGGASGAAKAGASELAARTAATGEAGRRAARLVARLISAGRSSATPRARDAPQLAAHPLVEPSSPQPQP